MLFALTDSAFAFSATLQDGDGDSIGAEAVSSPTDYAINGTKWGASQTMGTPGGVVTYSFVPSGVSCAVEFTGCVTTSLSGFMPSGWEAVIDSAFDAWAAVANITFQKVTDSGVAFNQTGAVGDIRITGHPFDGRGGTLAHAFYPQPTSDPSNSFYSFAGDLHFDIAENWALGSAGPGYSIYLVALHEIGHTLGLMHVSNPATLMYPYYTEAIDGLQAGDIAGAQYIYGPADTKDGGQVPLPGSLSLAGSALGLLAFTARRRRGAGRSDNRPS